MKTRALLLALPLVAVASCTDNRASITIQEICFPPDDCVFSSKCDHSLLGNSIVDAAGPGALLNYVQVANQLANNSSVDLQRNNTNDAHVDQIAVEYEGLALPKDVYNIGNTRIPAGGTQVVEVETIRPLGTNPAMLAAYAASAQAPQLVANVRLRGYYDDGSRFETGQFPITVNVCAGCLPAAPCAGGNACPGVPGMEPNACSSTN